MKQALFNSVIKLLQWFLYLFPIGDFDPLGHFGLAFVQEYRYQASKAGMKVIRLAIPELQHRRAMQTSVIFH